MALAVELRYSYPVDHQERSEKYLFFNYIEIFNPRDVQPAVTLPANGGIQINKMLAPGCGYVNRFQTRKNRWPE